MRTVIHQPVTEISTTQKEELGAIYHDGKKRYKYVKIANVTATVAGVAGDPVAYRGTYALGYSLHACVLDLTDADAQPICAGFLCGTITGTAGTSYYAWIQISGPVVVPTAIGGTPVIGSTVQYDTTDKTLTKHTGEIQAAGISTSATGANNTIIATCPE